MVCRVLDSSGSKTLAEYFNLDTNEFHLYIQQNSENMLIEHPHGKVKSYSGKIDSNVIKFDQSDSNYLIVNGEKFEIVHRK